MTRIPKVRRSGLIGASLVLAALVVVAVSRNRGSGLQHVGAAIRRGDVRDVVEATGTVNAVVVVQVGSQVSGIIARLNADFNSRVHKGDVIAEIEPSVLEGILLQTVADLESAKAGITAAEANLTKANAAGVQLKADFDRSLALSKIGGETDQALDLAKANLEAAKASVDVAAANTAQARAQVRQREAAAAVARTNLAHAVIRSPIDGVVVARNVDVGQTVAASLQAPTIFTIAQDLRQMRVYAKTDESDVGRIKLHQQVVFRVDAFPTEIFTGVVSQIRMNPTVVQNVVTYDAIIDFQNPELKLFPGMTAYVTIPVSTAEDVLMLPNAALRYRPPLAPEAVRELYRSHGIEPDAGPPKPGVPVTAVVWKLHPDGTIEPVKVVLGITDHAYTEIKALVNGELKEDDEVVTRSVGAASANPLGGPPQAPRR